MHNCEKTQKLKKKNIFTKFGVFLAPIWTIFTQKMTQHSSDFFKNQQIFMCSICCESTRTVFYRGITIMFVVGRSACAISVVMHFFVQFFSYDSEIAH